MGQAESVAAAVVVGVVVAAAAVVVVVVRADRMLSVYEAGHHSGDEGPRPLHSGGLKRDPRRPKFHLHS